VKVVRTMRTHFLQVIFFGFFLSLSSSQSMVTDDDDGPSPAVPVSSSSSSSSSASASSSTSSTPQRGSRIGRARALTVQLTRECVGFLQEEIAKLNKKPIRRRELPSTTAETPSPSKAPASPRKALPSPRAQSSPRGRVTAPDEYYKWRSSPNLKSSSERSSLRDSPAFTPIPLYPPRQIPTDKELAEFQAEYKRLQDEHMQAKEAYKNFKAQIEGAKKTEETENDNTLQSFSTSSASPLSYFTLMKALTRVKKAAITEMKNYRHLKKTYAIRKNHKGEIVLDRGLTTPRSTKSPSEPTLERALESPN